MMAELGSTSALADACVASPSPESAQALLGRLLADPSAGLSLLPATRNDLAHALLSAPPPRAPALALLKELTRLSAGTDTLANADAVGILVQDTAPLARGDMRGCAAGEVALRTLNNILLLHASTRGIMLPHIDHLVAIIASLSDRPESVSETQALDIIFLAFRLLFLCTVTPSPITTSLQNRISIFTTAIKTLSCLSPGGRDLPLAEALRLVFNITRHLEGREDEWTPLLHVIAELIPELSTDARLIPPLTSALNALLNLPLASLARLEGDIPAVLPSIVDVLEAALMRYLVRDASHLHSLKPSPACAEDGLSLSVALVPLFLLVKEIVMATNSATYVHQRWFPPSLDRSTQLRDRNDYRATLVRLLADDELMHAAGGMLLSICGGPQGLVDTIGYGPCAGFLLAAGLAGEVVPGLNAEELDPITGAPPVPGRGGVGGTGMSEPEAAEEAAQLMGTLDQLNRTGVVSVDTEAIRSRAVERHAVWEEEEAAREKEQEAKEEEEAIREMQAYKARTKRA